MDSPVAKIKERLGIEEIVSSYVKLERAGANLKAKCPFHNEKTPSFFVSPDRGTYYCFGCGASGDIFSFVEEFEGLDFKGALKLLAERAGVELPRYNKKEEGEKEQLYQVMEDSARYFADALPRHPDVVTYLTSRGLTEKSMQEFRVGFAQAEWRDLYSYLSKKGWSDEIMEKAGLVKKTEKPARPDGRSDGGHYDRFRGRIMFPIADSSGRIVAFSGRIFPVSAEGGSTSGGKYVNSPETPLWIKGAALYGIDKAKDAIRRNNFSILVEGQMDLIMSHQAGYRNTVAASGTALSESAAKENAISNMALVRRLSQNIVLALDGDAAGIAATYRAGKIALSLGMDVKVAQLPEGTDPADLIRTRGADAWREAIRNSTHIIESVLAQILRSKRDDPRLAGREINARVLPLISVLESAIERAHFLKRVSQMSGIGELALEDDLRKIEAAERTEAYRSEARVSQNTFRRKDYIKRKLLGLILWQQTLKEETVPVARLLADLESIFHVSGEALLKEAAESAADLIFEAEAFYVSPERAAWDAEEMILNLKEEVYKEELAEKMRELYQAEENKDKEKSARIFKECQALNMKIQDIKNGRIK